MKLRIHKSSQRDKLLEGCQKREPRAQKALYEKFAPAMFAICLRYVKDRDSAEDILITGFTRIFEKIDQFQGEGSFEGWIRRVIVNEALGFIRKNKNMYLEVDLESVSYQLDYDHLEKVMNEDALLSLIDGLSPGYKTIFNLYAIEGYSHQEISEMLGISVNTSKSQLSRARQLLQKNLKQYQDQLEKINYEDPKA